MKKLILFVSTLIISSLAGAGNRETIVDTVGVDRVTAVIYQDDPWYRAYSAPKARLQFYVDGKLWNQGQRLTQDEAEYRLWLAKAALNIAPMDVTLRYENQDVSVEPTDDSARARFKSAIEAIAPKNISGTQKKISGRYDNLDVVINPYVLDISWYGIEGYMVGSAFKFSVLEFRGAILIHSLGVIYDRFDLAQAEVRAHHLSEVILKARQDGKMIRLTIKSNGRPASSAHVEIEILQEAIPAEVVAFLKATPPPVKALAHRLRMPRSND